MIGRLWATRLRRPGWPMAWPSDWHWVALHRSADLVTVILPGASMVLVIGLAHDLTHHQRALFAAYPVSVVQIVVTQGSLVAGLDLAALIIADLVPWIAGWTMSPWALVAMEAARSPWAGLPTTWAGASVAETEYAVTPLPLTRLFYADAYASTGETWVNSAVILGMALLQWDGKGWLMGRAPAQGWGAL